MKLKSLLAGSFFLLITIGAIAQTTFYNSYEVPLTGCQAKKTLVMPNGDLITCGMMPGITFGDYDIFLVKSDTAGNVHWSKTIGSTDNNYFASFQRVSNQQFAILTYDSIAGSRYQSLILVDTTGAVFFQKTFQLGNGLTMQNERMIPITGGNFLIAGTSGEHLYLVSLNFLGGLNWTKDLYTAAGTILSDPDVTEMSNGDVAITLTMSGGGLTFSNLALLLVNNSGVLLSSQSFTGNTDVRSRRIHYSSNTGLLIIGADVDNGKPGLFFVDSDGNPIQMLVYITNLVYNGGLQDFMLDPVTDQISVLSPDYYYTGFQLSHFTANGNFMWAMYSPFTNQGGVSVTQDPSGAYIVTGNILSLTSPYWNMSLCRVMDNGLTCDNPATLTMNASGIPIGFSGETFNSSSGVTIQDTAITDTTHLFPMVLNVFCQEYVGITSAEETFNFHTNIVDHTLLIRTEEPYNYNDVIRITDMNGRTAGTYIPATGNYELSINISTLSAGCYVLSLEHNQKKTNKKFIVF